MEVKSVKENKDEIIVITTGAKYVFDKSGKNGKISCYQLLNKERLVASIDFNFPFSMLSIERNDETTCIFHQGTGGCGYLRFQINSDSLLDIQCFKNLSLKIQCNLLADYSSVKNGHILLIDEIGGIGFYPYEGLKNVEFNNSSCKEREINYELDSYCRFFVSVFPPRKFNYIQSFEERISHHGSIGPWDPPPPPYPSNEEIEEAGKHTNILVLHEMIWQGKLTGKGKPVKSLEDLFSDMCWCCYNYMPVNEKELIRVVKKAHSLKMRIIPYMSPFYSTAKGEDFLDKVKEKLEKYDFDGVYFDDISLSDMLYSYQIIRDTRKLLKDKILYYHCTSGSLNSRNVYCPFIDTYADYILRAESSAGFINDKYLRYVISGYNISNSIGYICHHSYALDFVRELIDKLLAVNARMYLGLGSPEIETEELIKKEYFPKLDSLKNIRGG